MPDFILALVEAHGLSVPVDQCDSDNAFSVSALMLFEAQRLKLTGAALFAASEWSAMLAGNGRYFKIETNLAGPGQTHAHKNQRVIIHILLEIGLVTI